MPGAQEAAPPRPLTRIEADRLVASIRCHLHDARHEVLELYERKGWVVLGYPSWRECVEAEFGQSQSRLYELLRAAEIERDLSANGVNIHLPERVLRALGPYSAEERQAIFEEVLKKTNGKAPKAREVEDAVDDWEDRQDQQAEEDNLEDADLDASLQALSAEAREEIVAREESAMRSRARKREKEDAQAALHSRRRDVIEHVRKAVKKGKHLPETDRRKIEALADWMYKTADVWKVKLPAPADLAAEAARK